MKRYLPILLMICVLVMIACVSVTGASAAGITAQEAPPAQSIDFNALVDSVKNLTGIGALIAVLINVAKNFGWVKDGDSGTWSAVFNLVVLLGLFAAQLFGYANLIPMVDEQAGGLAQVATVMLAFALQLLAARKTHDMVLAGLPLIGKSYTNRVAGENLSSIEITG